MSEFDIDNNLDFSPEGDVPTYSPHRIKVIGVGGGGSNAINHMYNMGERSVSFIVANTDRQALNNSPVPTKVLLGPNELKGRGAGNVPEKARKAAEESAEEINALFDDETDMVFITAGMGGGTGTGASPVISRIARERGLLTIGIVTIPFLFEGRKKIYKALEGAREMSKYVDALLVINNERLSDIYRDYDFMNAFGKADDVLAMAAISISEIVTCDGYINLDFNDVDNTLRNGGTAIIATGYGEGENRVTKAIEDALHSPLLKNTDIYGSKKLLFNLYFSPDADEAFKIEETNQITEFIAEIDKDVDVIWGVAHDNSLGNKVKFTILAAGFDVTLGDEVISPKGNANDDKGSGVTISGGNSKTEGKNALDEDFGDAYGADTLEKIKDAEDNNRVAILRPDQFDDIEVAEEINNTVALDRDRRKLNQLRTGGKTSCSQSASGSHSIEFDDL